jgi:hypothetical protein
VTDRAEQHRVGGARGIQRLRRDGLALLADGCAAYSALLVANLDAEVLGRGVDNLARGPDHLGPDAVAGK